MQCIICRDFVSYTPWAVQINPNTWINRCCMLVFVECNYSYSTGFAVQEEFLGFTVTLSWQCHAFWTAFLAFVCLRKLEASVWQCQGEVSSFHQSESVLGSFLSLFSFSACSIQKSKAASTSCLSCRSIDRFMNMPPIYLTVLFKTSWSSFNGTHLNIL